MLKTPILSNNSFERRSFNGALVPNIQDIILKENIIFCILYQHTATEGHSCPDLTPYHCLWSGLCVKMCKGTFKCKLKIANEKHLYFRQRFTEVEETGRTEAYFDNFDSDRLKTIAIFKQTVYLVLYLVRAYIEFLVGA